VNNIKTIFFICVITLSLSSFADDLFGYVYKVVDGDTVWIKSFDQNNKNLYTKFKVRLVGIDAPEINQYYGLVAKNFLKTRIFNKKVAIQDYGIDRYDRMLAKILLNDVDINALMIETGHAWFYKKYKRSLSLEDQQKYLELENNARNNKIGLFANSDYYIEPWKWRKNKSKN
jgi:endonuclease YncB( thermonuclease family)